LKKIAIVATEPSGDLIGSQILNRLKNKGLISQSIGLGGPHMIREGLHSIYDYNDFSVMGYAEIFFKLPTLILRRNKIYKIIKDFNPDVFIGVDAPDFNFFLEKKFKKNGVKTIHCVCPSIWAWKPERIKNFHNYFDCLLSILPFEKNILDSHKIKNFYMKNPFYESIFNLRREKSKKNNKSLLTFLPGSRLSELKKAIPLFVDVVKKLNHEKFTFNFVFANKYLYSNFYNKLSNDRALSLYNINYIIGNSNECIRNSDISIMSSGTVALEAALINCNSIIVYKLNHLTYLYVKNKIISDYVSLPNIILNKEVFPELLQEKMNSKNVLKFIYKILNDVSYRDYQKKQCELIQSQFSNSIDTFNECIEFVNL